jgi:hypothetical protein
LENDSWAAYPIGGESGARTTDEEGSKTVELVGEEAEDGCCAEHDCRAITAAVAAVTIRVLFNWPNEATAVGPTQLVVLSDSAACLCA